jgi:hypothetical protein
MTLALLMVLAAATYRLLPHPENFAPVAAMALLGGMYLGRRYALAVPVAALLGTDLVLNARMGFAPFYWPRLLDYGAFVLIGLLGLWARHRRPAAKTGCAVATPFVFFLLSNFGVWLFGHGLTGEPYPKTLEGLASCYAAALPFLRGTLAGDWLFMAAFAAVLALARHCAGGKLQWLVAQTRP